jgi:hypothetical protein
LNSSNNDRDPDVDSAGDDAIVVSPPHSLRADPKTS